MIEPTGVLNPTWKPYWLEDKVREHGFHCFKVGLGAGFLIGGLFAVLLMAALEISVCRWLSICHV